MKQCECGATEWATMVTIAFIISAATSIFLTCYSHYVRDRNADMREQILINAGKEPWAQRALGLKQEQKQ